MRLAVIGGGPVGLVTALLLEKEGYQIDVYETGSWPKDKTCGQGLMPSGKKLLEKLGVCFDEKDYFPFQGIHYQDQSLSIRANLPQPGHGIERKVLSRKLYEKVKASPSIFLHERTRVSNITQLNDHLVLEVNQEQSVSYPYAFACDGINSFIRKKLNNEKPRKSKIRRGAREHFNISPWSKDVVVYWDHGIEAYVTPVSQEKIEVAFLWYDKADYPKNAQSLRGHLFNVFPQLRARIPDEASCGDFKGHVPFTHTSINEKVGRVFFLGDAYCFLDGITGEGLSLGFKGAEIVSQNFQSWDLRNKIKFRFYYSHYSLMVYMALVLSYFPKLRSLVFKFCLTFPKSFQFILKFNDF